MTVKERLIAATCRATIRDSETTLLLAVSYIIKSWSDHIKKTRFLALGLCPTFSIAKADRFLSPNIDSNKFL